MPTITFEEFLEGLPRGDQLKAKNFPAGLSYVKSSNPCFVKPDVRIDEPGEAGQVSVILLAAPGAVGKSTIAAEIAATTGSLLWDLSKFQVGSGTFSGKIFEAYRFEATGVQKRLDSGDFLFVLDALDEAQVRAGSQNFDAFLHDLVEALKQPRQRPVIIVLARTDTADWVHLVLEVAGVPLARYQIEFFDRARAFSFINKRLDERRLRDNRQPIHRQEGIPFAEARDSLFGLIYQLFGTSEASAWDDVRVKDFLGYAPVLEAFADYLDVSNYMALVAELREGAPNFGDPWQFLTEILHRLLKREQSKVQVAVRPRLENAAASTGWSEWEKLYGPSEQRSRVLAHSLALPVDGLPLPLPPSLATIYEDAVKTVLPQHPYLSGKRFANVVFKEFTYAWGLTSASESLASGLREAIRNREEPFLPSQLFGRFVASLASDDSTPVLDGQDFGVFYESLLSRSDKVQLNLTETDEGLQASVTLDDQDEREINCQLLDTGSGVHFWRRLSNADIDVQVTVRLGLPVQRFLLGPGVDVSCSQCVVACGDLEVDVSENVILRAGAYMPSSPNLSLKVRNENQGILGVAWPGVAHPWATYRVVEGEGPLRLGQTVAGDTLRKFILMFRRQRRRKESTLKGARWSPEQLQERDRLVSLALQHGVLKQVSGFAAFEFNSDHDSLKTLVVGKPQLSPRTREFVVNFLGEEAIERILS